MRIDPLYGFNNLEVWAKLLCSNLFVEQLLLSIFCLQKTDHRMDGARRKNVGGIVDFVKVKVILSVLL